MCTSKIGDTGVSVACINIMRLGCDIIVLFCKMLSITVKTKKGTWNLSVSFLSTEYESIIVSNKISILK